MSDTRGRGIDWDESDDLFTKVAFKGMAKLGSMGEDRVKNRADYVESDSLPSIMTCLRRDDDVQSQSTSEATSLQDGLVCKIVKP